jgi:hypothetical protein
MVSAAWPAKTGNINAAASRIARNIVPTTCLLCCVSARHSGRLGAGADARGLIYVKPLRFKNRGFRVESRFTNHDSRGHLILRIGCPNHVASVAGPDSPGRIPGNRGGCFPAHVATSSSRCGSSAPSHRWLAPIRLVASPETGAPAPGSRGHLQVEHHTAVLALEVAAMLRTWPAGRRGNTDWAGRNAPGRVRSRRS